MAYIPPHKRRSGDGSPAPAPAPFPASFSRRFNRALNLDDSRRKPIDIFYAAGAVSRWFPVGAPAGGDPIPSAFRLEPFPCHVDQFATGGDPSVLVGGEGARGIVDGGAEADGWESVVERTVPEMVDTLERARASIRRTCPAEDPRHKISVYARVGKVVFLGGSSMDFLESIKAAAIPEADARKRLWKMFYTDLPDSHTEALERVVASKIGFRLVAEKEKYFVRVSEGDKPEGPPLLCKCTLLKESEHIEMKKIFLVDLRELVIDVSCLYKDFDLRLQMLRGGNKVLDDEEKDILNKLIESAVRDTNVKGKLRWPLGMESSAHRFAVLGVWHVTDKIFDNGRMKLRLRVADRFDYSNSTGDVSYEATFKLTDIRKLLLDVDMETASLKEMVQDAVKIIWQHFLTRNAEVQQ